MLIVGLDANTYKHQGADLSHQSVQGFQSFLESHSLSSCWGLRPDTGVCCVCVRACVRACVRVSVRACERACV
jgi:hypothetical protein